jgi:glycosyltransferase involved in cell wall biosynthesis
MEEEKIKVIHIEHCSHSYFLSDKNGNPDDIVKGSWGTQVVREIRKQHPEIEVECWFPEKTEKKEKSFEHWGVKLRIFPTTFSPMYALDFSLPMLRALKKEIKKCHKENKKVIIQIHEYHNLHGLALAFLFRKEKLIAQHHGGSYPLKHLKQTKRYRLFFPLFFLGQFIENLVLKNIKVFFALSQDEINYLKKIAPNSKVRFQTMGIEEIYYKKGNKKLDRKKLNLDLNKKIIIYIGRINEEKGIKYLLDAMINLKEVNLKIIGYLQKVDYFKEYAKEKKLDNVEFLGGVFGEKKLLYLSAADALILPSTKEGAPVVIMEALSRNTPVVATDVGGIPLMIENNREGVIIKQKNSEEIVRGIKEILKWKNKDVKKYANKYKWKKIIDDTVEDYKKFN